MRRNARKQQKKEAKRGVSEALQLMVPLATVIRQDLRAFVLAKGMEALQLMLEQERDVLCGRAYGRGATARPSRAGSAPGELVMGGRRVTVKRPRVRHEGNEVRLQAWGELAAADPLNERTYEQMIIGVSTRNYERSLEPVPEALNSHSTSKSSVSRRFVAVTRKGLADWVKRDLSGMALTTVMIDGIDVGDHVILIALGIDDDGRKQVLGLTEGATENSAATMTLLSDLVERGLQTQRSKLFVIDGAKALRKAIRDVFGRRAKVQRCQIHKRRNVLGHLPESMHRSVDAQLREAYNSRSKKTAKRRLEQLASHLERDYPSAATSIREGLDETLTVVELGLPELLSKTLRSTNVIENLNEGVRHRTRRVKRWQGGRMILRWVAASLLEADQRFHRIKGYRSLPILTNALRENDAVIDGANETLDAIKRAA